MESQATTGRSLKALLMTGMSIFAIAPVFAGDPVKHTANAAEKPRLILQITVDQLRGGLPTRYFDRLGEGGLRFN